MSREIDLPSNKKFGLFFFFIFLILSAFFFYQRYETSALICFLISLSFLVAAVIAPGILRPLNVFWMWVGVSLGKIMNPIIMGFLFFLIISPIAIIWRLCGRDELQLKMSTRASYWNDRPDDCKDIFFDKQY